MLFIYQKKNIFLHFKARSTELIMANTKLEKYGAFFAKKKQDFFRPLNLIFAFAISRLNGQKKL